jgi:hypothetical protein
MKLGLAKIGQSVQPWKTDNKMKLATKTLQAIEASITADQGNAYRKALGEVLPLITDAYRSNESSFRTHMGASGIGAECSRELWYSFRWFLKTSFDGRILRLFNRGHLEEAHFIAMLLTAGYKVHQQDANGNQYRIINHGGHFGGSCDGVVEGLPDVPEGRACLLEFKTHNDASFRKLIDKGVEASKPQHYTQMQMYMEGLNLDYALYMAVNKNDDSLHAEVVTRSGFTAEQFSKRAERLIFATTPPERINESPSWYLCKWCAFNEICHKHAVPESNCRTCTYATAEPDGTWFCRYHDKALTTDEQLTGCASHDFLR